MILLIVSMVQASKDLEQPAGVIACGTFATLFVLISGIFNCITCVTMNTDNKNSQPES